MSHKFNKKNNMTNEIAKKESTELDSMSEEDLLNMWKKDNIKPMSRVNRIKLNNVKLDDEGKINPDFGKLFAYRYEDNEEIVTELKPGFEFYPIRVMVQIKCRDYDEENNRFPYFCKEVEEQQDIELIDSATKEVVYTGPYKNVKEKYNLKYQLAIYAYVEGVVYRWLVGGESLGSWWEAQGTVNNQGYPHAIKLLAITPEKNGTVHYNNLAFQLGERFDLKTAVMLRKQLEDHQKDGNEQVDSFNEFLNDNAGKDEK